MESIVVYSGGVTNSVQVYCQVSPRSFGNWKFCGGRLELGRHVEVIVVGSQRDAVLDFCLESPYKSPTLRLWTAVTKEPTKLQLQQRLLEKDFVADIVDPPSLLQSSPLAIIIGWFYFHTGDRWFANFWKGKANGEGRFYTKSGDVFFGDFKDGWRQGHFFCIGVDGQRFLEIWDRGILISRQQISPASDGKP